jgi:hypothetical protein
MVTNKNTALVAGAVCCLLGIGARVACADDVKAGAATPVSMALSPKVGDAVRYESTLKIVGDSNIVVEQSRMHTVQQLRGSGEVVVLVEDEGGKALVGGNEIELSGGSAASVTLNKANKILSYKPEGAEDPYLSPSSRHLIALVERAILPDKPVRPGDSWTTAVENPAVPGKMVTIKTTYVGEDKAEGVPVWKLQQTLEADTEVAGSKMKAESTALLDASNGQLISEQQTVKGLTGSMGPVDWSGTIQRVRPEPGK